MWRLELPEKAPKESASSSLAVRIGADRCGARAIRRVEAWEKVYFRGSAPTPRDSYSQCVIDQAWYLHGGRGLDGTNLMVRANMNMRTLTCQRKTAPRKCDTMT
eukprot:1180150-Prorocentrum_minimum.AAC.6